MTPRRGYFFDPADLPWDNETIAANDETKPEECLGYSKKTIYFLSDANGTLTIYADATGDADFQVYDTIVVVANTVEVYPMTGGATYVKLAFSAIADVTAKYVFE